VVLDSTRPYHADRIELTPPANGPHPRLGIVRNVPYLAKG
jgi:hypothetical protein